MRESLITLFRTMHPIYPTFLAGVLVSAAVNLATSVILSEPKDHCITLIWTAIGLQLLASALLTALSYYLQRDRDLGIYQAPAFLPPKVIDENLREQISTDLRLLTSITALSFLTFLGSIACLGASAY